MSDKQVCPKCGKVDCPCDPETCDCGKTAPVGDPDE